MSCLKKACFTSSGQRRYKLCPCQNVCDALSYLIDSSYIRFGTKLYRQIVAFPMGTKCAPLVADLFLFCYERNFMTSLSDDNQADIIEAFTPTSRYLDDLLNIDNPYFEGMVSQIYPIELQLDKAKTAITLTPPTVGRQSADLSADKMPDFSSFFIGRQFLGFGNRPTIGRCHI